MNTKLSCSIKKKSILLHELGGKCEECNESHIVTLVFHHVDQSTKSFEIGQNYGKRLSELREEASKCIILCRNCHKEKHSSKNLTAHGIRKIKALQYKKTKCCSCCGYSKHNDALDFHHIDPSSKEFEFREVRFSPNNDIPESVKYELDKCIVLCSNCHAKEHAKYDLSLVSDDSYIIREKRIVPVEKILQLKSNNHRLVDICKILNLPKSTVSTVLKNNGIVSFTGVDSGLILQHSTNNTVAEISEITGYSKNSIRTVLDENNITPIVKYKSKLKITIEDLTELRASGKSFREIGVIYGVSWKAIRDRAILLGIYSPNSN